MMRYWTDIFLPRSMNEKDAAAAFALAFGMKSSQVAVVPRSTDAALAAANSPRTLVLVQHQRGDDPQFPWALAVGLRDHVRVIDPGLMLQTLAGTLGMMRAGDVPADGQDTWRLVLPNGTWTPLGLNDDGSFDISDDYASQLCQDAAVQAVPR